MANKVIDFVMDPEVQLYSGAAGAGAGAGKYVGSGLWVKKKGWGKVKKMPFLDASKKIFKSGLKGAVGGALVGLGTAAVAKKPALAFRENLLDSIDEDTVDDLDKASSLKAKILKPAKKAVGAVKEFWTPTTLSGQQKVMSETMANIKKHLGNAPGGKQLNIEFAGDKARKAMLEDRKKVNRNIAMFGVAPPVAMQGISIAKESSLLKLGFKK